MRVNQNIWMILHIVKVQQLLKIIHHWGGHHNVAVKGLIKKKQVLRKLQHMEFPFRVNQITDFLSIKQHSSYKQLSTTVIMDTQTHSYTYIQIHI